MNNNSFYNVTSKKNGKKIILSLILGAVLSLENSGSDKIIEDSNSLLYLNTTYCTFTDVMPEP